MGSLGINTIVSFTVLFVVVVIDLGTDSPYLWKAVQLNRFPPWMLPPLLRHPLAPGEAKPSKRRSQPPRRCGDRHSA